MNWDDYAEWSARIGSWGAAYHKSLRDRPVRAQTSPGEIAAQLPASPPESGEEMAEIFADMLDSRADAIVTGSAAAAFYLDLERFEIELVIEDRHVFGLELVVAHRFADGLA